METAEIRADLKAAGLRVTQPRVAALATLRRGGHYSVERLLGEVRGSIAHTSFQTMYGVLEALCARGLARKIEFAGGFPALFEADFHDNHHHTVCRECGRVEDTPCDTGSAPCLHPPLADGFEVHLAEVTFYGVCADCRDPHPSLTTS